MNTIESKENTYIAQEKYDMAYKRVKKIKGFYVHLIVYVCVNLLLLGLIFSDLKVNESYFQIENFSTAFFWGIGLVCHAFSVFVPNVFLGKNWEERKIKDLINQENKNTQNWS